MSKGRLLYIGNMLSKYGKNPTSVETLGPLLSKYYNCILISDKRSKGLRLLHIVYTVLLNRKRVDVILIDTYSSAAFYFATVVGSLARIFHIPYVLILRGGDLERRLIKGDGKKLFNQAYQLVAPSNYMHELFKRYGFNNLSYIPNTIDLKNYVFTSRQTFSFRMLWVRAFQSIYNPKMAIDVLNMLVSQGYEAKLCMVGPDKDGSMQECKDYIQSLGLTAHVKITGKLSKEDWLKLAEEYDVFINTTTVDNTPVSVIEAMALGLPVVSTNVGGIPFLLEDGKTACLVENGDAEGMAVKVKNLMEGNSGKQMAIQARKKVESFDWMNVKYEWFRLFKELKLTHSEHE